MTKSGHLSGYPALAEPKRVTQEQHAIAEGVMA